MLEKVRLKDLKKQRKYYSGKKKRHTIKTQIIVDKKSKKIICTAVEKGRKHDFRLFKESKTAINPSIKMLADSGYQGIQKIHSNCEKPIKGTKKKPLTKEDKKHNHEVIPN